jgi:hypothetical protein
VASSPRYKDNCNARGALIFAGDSPVACMRGLGGFLTYAAIPHSSVNTCFTHAHLLGTLYHWKPLPSEVKEEIYTA